MKRYIHASEETSFTNADIVRMLQKRGIDTTKNQYELRAQVYDRYEDSPYYTRKFSCPGDYLAYLSMTLHEVPSAESMKRNWWQLEDFEEVLEDYPTIEDISNHAAESWWGDGDDYIIYLKNLTTGEYLYGPEEVEEYYEDEDWED